MVSRRYGSYVLEETYFSLAKGGVDKFQGRLGHPGMGMRLSRIKLNAKHMPSQTRIGQTRNLHKCY